ncbi:MAG: CHAT domain-containing protein [Bacteroidota bacterium]
MNLDREVVDITKYLLAKQSRGECQLIYLPNPTREEFYNTLGELSENPGFSIFHFSGHTDGDKYFVRDNNRQPTEVLVKGITELLGKSKGLKLVFLNGCHNISQVKLLHDAGVKAIIATNRKVNDSLAQEIASNFYKCLAENYSIGQAFDNIRRLYSFGSTNELETHPNVDVDQEELPWGLYLKPEHSNILEWKLPENSDNIHTDIKYTCDRFDQNRKIASFLLPKLKDRRCYSFCLHGNENQSLNGFIERIKLQYFESQKVEQINLTSGLGRLNVNYVVKNQIRDKLLKALNLSDIHDQATIADILSHPTNSLHDVLVIIIDIKERHWLKKETSSLINWVNNDLQLLNVQKKQGPLVIVFFNFFYNNSSYISRLIRTGIRRELDDIRSFKELNMVDELKRVPYEDIDEWLEQFEKNKRSRNKIISQYIDKGLLGKKKYFDMDKIEVGLERYIINQKTTT